MSSAEHRAFAPDRAFARQEIAAAVDRLRRATWFNTSPEVHASCQNSNVIQGLEIVKLPQILIENAVIEL